MSFIISKHNNKSDSLMNNKYSVSVINNGTSGAADDILNQQTFEADGLVQRKSNDDLLIGGFTRTDFGSNNSVSQEIHDDNNQTVSSSSFTSVGGTTVLQSSPLSTRKMTTSPSVSPQHSPKRVRDSTSGSTGSCEFSKCEIAEDNISKSSDSSYLTACELNRVYLDTERPKNTSKLERAKKKAWYSVLYPSYKSRSEDFKKLFKEVPDDERLVVDYSSALQKDILVHGRLYVSQNYVCFYANIFRWETYFCIRWKDVTAITKEKTARVIPNAILICTESEKLFLTSFTTRDKAYLMLFRVWQNALMDKPMLPQEMWQWVHNCYGDELGLTSDDEDYIDPYDMNNYQDDTQQINNHKNNNIKHSNNKSAESLSEDHSEPYLNQSSTNKRKPSADDSGSGDRIENNNKNINTVNTQDNNNNNNNNNNNIDNNKIENNNGNDIMVIATTTSAAKYEQKLVQRKYLKSNRKRDDSTNLPSEQLPTDISDSSDSDSGKNVPFVSTTDCTSLHEGRQLVHTILPINVDTLMTLLFSKSKFLVDFHNNRKTTNMKHNDWTVNQDGLKTRTVNLTVTLTQAVGPKCSHVTEVQTMRDCSVPGQLYSIDIVSTNAGIPYADSFFVSMHYCLVRTVDDHTMFSVHAQIKYKKSVWGVVKGFIEKNAWAGLEDFYTALLRTLQNEYCIPPAKSKGRRPRKGISAQQRQSEEPIHQKDAQISFTNQNLPSVGDLNKKLNTEYTSISWFIIIVLMLLILVNVILFIKLSTLEERYLIQSNYPSFPTLKNSPKSHEDWLTILQQQEALHATEMIKWQKILQTAIDLLKKVSRACEHILDAETCVQVTNFVRQ